MARKLTDEGKALFAQFELIKEEIPVPKPIKQVPLQELQIEFFIHEIGELLDNSRRVVEDCDYVLSLCTDKHEYLKQDAKVAKMIHLRLITKYTKLLNWESALG